MPLRIYHVTSPCLKYKCKLLFLAQLSALFRNFLEQLKFHASFHQFATLAPKWRWHYTSRLTICQTGTISGPLIFRAPSVMPIMTCLVANGDLISWSMNLPHLSGLAAEQTLVINGSGPGHPGFYFTLPSSYHFFQLSLHHACRFRLRCGRQALQVLPRNK